MKGRVIGVGFRAFVKRIALDCAVKGFVKNLSDEVEVHAEALDLTEFMKRVSGIKSTSFIGPHAEEIIERECHCKQFTEFNIVY